MQVSFRLILCSAILSFPFAARAQDSPATSGVQVPDLKTSLPSVQLLDAPAPQAEVLALLPGSEQQSGNGSGSTQNGTTQGTAQDSSSAQTPAAQSDAEKSQHDKAQEQLKEQEHQRVMGVMATFNTTRNKDALPLSPGQKFQLFFRSSTDPWPFLLAGVVSGIGQADDSYSEWGQGVQGYAKRFGAAYSDAFIGNFFGNAVLPVVLKEDPRYFQKGTGSVTRRFLWAASSTVWCRRDKGTWGPNYANVGGNLIGAAIARVYYPASERTVSDTINDGLTVSLEGIVGAEIIEFWPDIARHYKRKHDEKMAKKAAQSGANTSAPDAAPASTSQKPQN
jgi:hypothetical protein